MAPFPSVSFFKEQGPKCRISERYEWLFFLYFQVALILAMAVLTVSASRYGLLHALSRRGYGGNGNRGLGFGRGFGFGGRGLDGYGNANREFDGYGDDYPAFFNDYDISQEGGDVSRLQKLLAFLYKVYQARSYGGDNQIFNDYHNNRNEYN